MPRVKPSSYNLRKETCFKPKIDTMSFKNSFTNRLVFKYELAIRRSVTLHRQRVPHFLITPF